ALRWVIGAPPAARKYQERIDAAIGPPSAFQDIWSVMNSCRSRFYSAAMFEQLGDYLPYVDLAPDRTRLAKWHPLNRGLYWGARIHLSGLLLASKGDRVAMNSSVETRYPFLDDDVVSFLAGLDPGWKLRGFRDKYLLRRLGERWLPREIAWRPKGMF